MKEKHQILINALIIIIFIINGCVNEPITTIDSFDGVSISFDNKGNGEAAIILVHGWANDRTIWDGQIDHFSDSYQVIAVDLPGFGKSGNNRNEWSIASYGKDISTIIQQLNLKKVVLVGFSLGAPIIIEAASKISDHVIGIVLVDGLQEVERKISPSMAHYVDSVMMDLVNNPTKEKFVGSGFIKNDIDSAYLRIVTMLENASRIGWRESLAGYIKWQNEQCTNSIQAIKAPIIAINSEIEPTYVEDFRKYAPTFKTIIVKDVGHLVMWDNPEKFNQLLEASILEFMSE
jgi:pimeloyl-ACP methyl ester carboxylesterase